MTLTGKKYSAIHSKTGSDKDTMKGVFDDGHTAHLADNPDDNPTITALMYQIQEMQDELDEIRRFIVSNEVLATSGVGGALPTRASRNSGDLWNDRGIVKVV